jgi:hypothetical protein
LECFNKKVRRASGPFIILDTCAIKGVRTPKGGTFTEVIEFEGIAVEEAVV